MQLICSESKKIGRRRGQRGYSLIELLVAIGVSAVALSAFTAFNRFQLFALRNQATQIDLQTSARVVTDLIAREVRRAGMNPKCAAGFTAITTAKSSEIQINADLDSSGALGGTNETITYKITNTTSTKKLERITTASTDNLLLGYDLTGSAIQYYDGSGTELVPPSGGLTTAQRSTVRRIRVKLSLSTDDFDPLTSQKLSAQVSTDIDLRNRFFLTAPTCTS
jgi:prepilin-type N-terminal cleavage/methylation domain-containing protein